MELANPLMTSVHQVNKYISNNHSCRNFDKMNNQENNDENKGKGKGNDNDNDNTSNDNDNNTTNEQHV